MAMVKTVSGCARLGAATERSVDPAPLLHRVRGSASSGRLSVPDALCGARPPPPGVWTQAVPRVQTHRTGFLVVWPDPVSRVWVLDGRRGGAEAPLAGPLRTQFFPLWGETHGAKAATRQAGPASVSRYSCGEQYGG